MEWIQNNIAHHESEFLVYSALLLLLGIARFAEDPRLQMFLKSFSNTTLVDQQLRQERAFSRLALIAFAIVLITISAFLSLGFQYFGVFRDFSFLGLSLSIFMGLILLTTARVAVYALVAWLFELEELQQQHAFHWLLTNFILCAVLLPICILISFGPDMITGMLVKAGALSLMVFYGIRVVRLAGITHSTFRVPLHYNFLYICALEILPVLLVFTLISRQIAG